MSKIKSINSKYSKATLSKEWTKNVQYKVNIAKKCMILIKKKSLTRIFIFWPSSHLWLKIMIQEFHIEAINSLRLTWDPRQRFQGEKRLIIVCTYAFCCFFDFSKRSRIVAKSLNAIKNTKSIKLICRKFSTKLALELASMSSILRISGRSVKTNHHSQLVPSVPIKL